METIKYKNMHYVIYDWMRERLNLKGIALKVYAIIFSFSRANGRYFGSQAYLRDCVGSRSIKGIYNALKRLLGQGLISKRTLNNATGKTDEYKVLNVQEVFSEFDKPTKNQEKSVRENERTNNIIYNNINVLHYNKILKSRNLEIKNSRNQEILKSRFLKIIKRFKIRFLHFKERFKPKISTPSYNKDYKSD